MTKLYIVAIAVWIVTEADIVHINHTYPFGMAMEGNWNNAGTANNNNRYLYNGKEWNDDFGLGWNDYGARFYDPAMARWQAIDSLADKYYRWSPYNYCLNNPVNFTDPDGMQVLLTRKFLNGSNVDTYNLYNDSGQLIAVLPPGCTEIESLLSFRYRYDLKNRLTQKRVPGAGWQTFEYDDRDLLVLTQDANTRIENQDKYLAMQYDELGRPIQTGWVFGVDQSESALHYVSIDESYSLTQTTYESAKSYVSRTKVRVITPQGLEGWLINEVQDRDQWGKPIAIRQTNLLGEDIIKIDYNSADRPLKITRIHSFSANNEVIFQSFTYDKWLRSKETQQWFEGRTVGDVPKMILSQMNYNFKGQLIEKNIGKKTSGNGRFLQSIDYLYNGRGWLTSINGFGMVATNRTIPMVKKDMDTYEEMIDIYSSESSPGNENDANGDLFSQVLNYEAPISGLYATAQYNGNISSTIWQVAGREKQAYGFKYDDLNRLTEAYYADVHATENNRAWNRPNVTFSTDNVYKEKMQYDVRGNITSLQRNGLKVNGFTGSNYVSGDFGKIDDLQYEYNNQNQVTRITDNAVDPNGLRGPKDTKGFVYNFEAANLNEHYKYDKNGNLTYDAHKDIETIEYNYMNLPAKITFTNNRTITFLYDATGKKLRKTVTGNGMTEQRDYLDGIEYKDGKPDQFLHSEGSVRMDKDGQFKYSFVLRDHLGNTRVTFSDLNNDDEIHEKEEIIQINNYYAFGLNMEGNWNGANGANKYQYNGKEWNDDFGLGWNDYGARFYDPAMARWQTVDPLAEKYHRWSPYNYTANNPIRYIDPDGMQLAGAGQRSISAARNNGKTVEGDYYNEKGKYLGTDNKEDKRVYVVTGATATQFEGKSVTEDMVNGDIDNVFLLPSIEARSEISDAMRTAHGNTPIDYEIGGIGYYDKPRMSDDNVYDGSITYVGAEDGVNAAGKSGAHVDPFVPSKPNEDKFNTVMNSNPLHQGRSDGTKAPGNAQVAYTWHSHPNGGAWGQAPSNDDVGHAGRFNKHTSNFVLSQKEGTVYLYKASSSGTSNSSGQMNLSIFYSLGKK